MFEQVKLGAQYSWKGRVIEADGVVSSSTISARDVATGERLTVPIEEMTSTKKLEQPLLDSIPQEAWDMAKNKSSVLIPLLAHNRLSKGQLEQAAKLLGKSRRQIQRYMRKLRVRQQISSLVHAKRGRRIGSRALPTVAERLLSHCLVRHYLVPERCSAIYVAERVERLARRIGTKPPSRATIYRRIAQMDRAETLAARHGSRVAREKYEPSTGGVQVSRPLELVQIDHTKVDLFLVSDDEFRQVIGRPYLTLAIDVFSRCIVGLVVSLDEPSALSVALCISHMVLPKGPWLKEMGVDVPYPMHGRPLRIGTDNAQEFRGSAMARGCDELGIILEHRPVGYPNWGGNIERVMGTMMGRVHCLPGTTFSSVHQRGEHYDSEAKACMTLNEFRRWFIYEVCTRYHQTIHRSLGRTPASVWEEGIRASSGGVQEVVNQPLDVLAWFLPAERRKVRRDGIELFGLRYWHPELEDLIRKGEPVLVNYDPRDVSRVYVRASDGQVRSAPVITHGAKAVSLYEHQQTRRLRRKAAKNPAALALLDAGIEAADALVATSRKATRTARIRIAREQDRRISVKHSSGMATSPVPTVESFSPVRPPRHLPVEHWN